MLAGKERAVVRRLQVPLAPSGKVLFRNAGPASPHANHRYVRVFQDANCFGVYLGVLNLEALIANVRRYMRAASSPGIGLA
jgi:hypothetical protein